MKSLFGFDVMQERIIHLLQNNTYFRERKNKDDLVIAAVSAKYPILMDKIFGGLDEREREDMRKSLRSFVRDIETADRARRKVMEEHAELHGTDYPNKTELEEEAQLELGYTSQAGHQ